MNILVLYEDESLVVVDKPAGMVVDEVAAQTGARLVHRLDRDTSGIMVLAKNASAELDLKKQFEERKVVKKYLALVHGEMPEDQGLITTPLAKHPQNRTRVVVGGETDRSAITEWKVTKRIQSYTLVELLPHTGRTHQLRVHPQSIGHPIVADPIYGYRKKLKADLAFCPRLFLHATYLEFTHPTTGRRNSFTSQLPTDLQTVVDNLVH